MTQAALRILVGLESSGPGGAENMVLSLAEGLSSLGHQPLIVTDKAGWMTERAEAAGVPVWVETQHRFRELPWALRMAWRMRRERIDIFHSHEFSMNVFGAAAAWLARVPHIATIHGRQYVTEAPRRIGAYRLLRRLGVPIVAVSEDLRGYLAKGFRLERGDLRLVHNGIALPNAFQVEWGRREELRQKSRTSIGLPSVGPLLVCVGNLYPVKDHASLVRVLPELPEAQLAIAGRGDEESNLRALAAELGVAERLHLLGLRDDVDAILAAADVFVQPSRSEGLPLAVLEAMAHGLPVVATAVGGIPEAIEDQKSGLLVPQGDSAAMARALRQILESPKRAESLSRCARARAETEFSVETMVKSYVELYGTIGHS
jgi:glycosyltransferase involved in cell wall biosynthesis